MGSIAMNRFELTTALVLIGSIGVSVWSGSSFGEASKGLSGTAVHQLSGSTQMDRLQLAPSHDHGFVFAPRP
jgi:hypothetical protein